MAKPSKKDGKKGKAAAAKAELARIEAEKAKYQMVMDERERLIQDRVMLAEKAKLEDRVQEERRRQLAETAALLQDIEDDYSAKQRADLVRHQWEQFMKCDRLPDPASPSQMNTYIFVWRETDCLSNIDEATTKTTEVLYLLDVLSDLIDYPPLDTPSRQLDLWTEMRGLVRAEQQRHLDAACYRLLRHLESALEAESLEIVRYFKECDHFKLCLWAQLMLPVASTPDEERPNIQCEFLQIGVSIMLPKSLTDVPTAIRGMWVQFDHYSDRCPSYYSPPLPPSYRLDMAAAMEEESIITAMLREELGADLERRLATVEKLVREVQARPVPGTESKDKPPPPPSPELNNYELGAPTKSPSEMMSFKDDERERELREEMRVKLKPSELNLRRMAVLGGTLHLDLALQPPQPRELRKRFTITVLEGSDTLQHVPFYQPYQPPTPPEAGQIRLPEEIEAELKQAEKELELLVLVSIVLPENVLWFEPPTVVGWDEEAGFWTSEDYHDIKFNEEKQMLTFRASRMRPLGLAMYRYCNLPYQGWEMKPDTKSAGVGAGGAAPTAVLLSVTAAVVMVEFTIRDSEMCLNQLQNGPNNALQDIVGKYMKPRELFKMLRAGGLDLSPADDAACYCEGMATKHRPTERHLYHTMALLCNTYNFTWSRWNQQAGTRNIIMQYREYLDRKKVGSYNMLMVTPTMATILECSEVSTQFNNKAAVNVPFYADLFHMIQDQCSLLTKSRVEQIPFTFVETVYDVLQTVRMLSSS